MARKHVATAPAGKTLMLCGSTHPANRLQAERLREARGVPCFAIPASGLAATLKDAAAHLRRSAGVSLLAPENRTASTDALRLTTSAATQLIADAKVTRLFVSGGETGHAVCGALGIFALQFVAELEAGVALAAAQLQGKSMLLAVKPGGFGDAMTWVRAWDALAR